MNRSKKGSQILWLDAMLKPVKECLYGQSLQGFPSVPRLLWIILCPHIATSGMLVYGESNVFNTAASDGREQ